MEEYQKRVTEEKKELDQKIERLNLFVNTDHFSALKTLEREQLTRQRVIMELYQEVLWQRIRDFN